MPACANSALRQDDRQVNAGGKFRQCHLRHYLQRILLGLRPVQNHGQAALLVFAFQPPVPNVLAADLGHAQLGRHVEPEFRELALGDVEHVQRIQRQRTGAHHSDTVGLAGNHERGIELRHFRFPPNREGQARAEDRGERELAVLLPALEAQCARELDLEVRTVALDLKGAHV